MWIVAPGSARPLESSIRPRMLPRSSEDAALTRLPIERKTTPAMASNRNPMRPTGLVLHAIVPSISARGITDSGRRVPPRGVKGVKTASIRHEAGVMLDVNEMRRSLALVGQDATAWAVDVALKEETGEAVKPPRPLTREPDSEGS